MKKNDLTMTGQVQQAVRLFCLFLFVFGSWLTGFSQVSITVHNTDFVTNLNGWNGTLPTGYTRFTNNGYIGTASSTTGGVYAIPGAGFGYRPSSNSTATTCWLMGTYQNNTGSAITSLQISYQAFQVSAAASRTPNWTVTSSLGTVSALTWNFNASTTPTSPDNLTMTLAVNIPAGGTYTVTFSSDRGAGSGSSPLIGINNIKMRSITSSCAAPTGLTAANITDATADLSWDAQAGAAGYEYVVDQTATAPTGAGTATAATTYSVAGLTQTTTYYLHVRTDCGSGSFSAWTTIPFTTLASPCAAPTGLTAATITNASADLSWDAQAGAAGYEYVVDQTPADPSGAGTTTTATAYSASGLTELTTYYLHVRTNCGGSNFSPWTTISFTTLVTPCAAPTGLAAANVTHDAADLSWSAQTGVAGYEYVVDQTSADPAGAGTATTATTYSATGLSELTTYYLHVRTDCGGGNLSPWTTISFTTPVTPCAAPTGLTAANVTHDAADLSWDTQTGAADYEYVLDQIAADPAGAGTGTPATTYSATGLAELTTYYLHVRTDCGNSNFSPWVTISFTTPVTPCDAPTGLTAANITHDAADLSWNTQATASDYEYVVDQLAADPTGAGTGTPATSYSTTGLTELTTYYLHVRTDCGNSNFSPWVTMPFTTPVTPCAAPTGLTAANITHDAADLSWDAQATASYYEYVVDQIAADPTGAGTSTTTTTYDATGLTELTTYYLHVRTDCGNANFSPWVTIPFTTLVTPCAAPTGLTATNVTDATADLSWNGQTGVTGYEYVVNQITTDPVGAGSATTSTTFNATGLPETTTLYLHVRTNCGNGNFSPWVTISFTTLVTPCAAPTGLSAVNVTDVAADLSWATQTGASYEYVINQNNGNPSGAGTALPDAAFSATGLTPATTYYLHVRTDCGGGNFSPWVTIPFTTESSTCADPTGVSTANITTTSADLFWNVQAGATGYEYVVNQSSANPSGTGTAISTNAVGLTTLTPNTSYFLHVRVNCGNGFSAWVTIPFSTLSGLGLDEQSALAFEVFPNPATTQVTIQVASPEGTVTLIDLHGKQLQTITLVTTSVMNLSGIESGVYMLLYETKGLHAVTRLIKE